MTDSAATTTERIQSFYRRHALIYDATRWISLRGRERAVRELGVNPRDRVLEVGCGTGSNFAAIVRSLDRRKGSLVGVDFSPAMLERARRRIAAAGWTNVRLATMDATQLALDDRFERILLSYALSIMPNWRAVLERAAHHLVTGGKIVAVDFGDFEKWGPMRGPMFGWLRANHTEAGRRYVEALRGLVGNVSVEKGWGGYYAIASGTK